MPEREPVVSVRPVQPGGGSTSNIAGAIILFCLLCLRILVLFLAGNPGDPVSWSSWTIEPDSHTYLALAEDLSDGTQDSASTRTPAYPVLILALSGKGLVSTLPLVLLQQLADLATALLIGAMAFRSGCRTWWAASACYLALPAAAATSSRILPDTLLALLAAASGMIWLEAAATDSRRRLTGAYALIGLLLSAGSLLKPVFLFAPAVYVLLVPFLRVRSGATRIAAVLVMLAAAAAGPAFWRLHNRSSFGLDAISAQDGYEQAGRVWILTGRATQYEFLNGIRDSVETLSTREGTVDYDLRSSIYREMALEEFRRHPADVIVPHLTSWPRFFSTGVGNTLRYLGLPEGGPAAAPLRAASALVILAMPSGFAAGLFIGRIRRRLHPLMLLAGAWMFVMSLVHGPLAGPRYGLTFFPLLCAAGIASLCLLASSSTETKRMGTSSQ